MMILASRAWPCLKASNTNFHEDQQIISQTINTPSSTYVYLSKSIEVLNTHQDKKASEEDNDK
jgi:hypothetical protein